MHPLAVAYQELVVARNNWRLLSAVEREEVSVKVSHFRNACLRLAAERNYPRLELIGREQWYVVSRPAWEQFTAQARIGDLFDAAMEMDDPLSKQVRSSDAVLAEWPDPTVGMFE